MLNLTRAVRQLKKERAQAQRRLEQLDTALEALGGVGGLNRGSVRARTNKREAKADVGCCSQTDCCCPTSALGQMEGGSEEKVRLLALCGDRLARQYSFLRHLR